MRAAVHALVLASLTLAAASPAAAQRVTVVSTISRARRMAEGRTARVEGIVTVAPGVVDAGFAIQDATGGIYVAADGSAPRLSPGERVRVEGRVGATHGLVSITPAAVRRIGSGRVPKPRRVRTGAVGAGNEGRLVVVQGVAADSASADPPYGHKLRVDDGSGAVQVFFPAGAGSFALWRVRAGTRVRVTGFSGRFEGIREVIPRSAADLAILAR